MNNSNHFILSATSLTGTDVRNLRNESIGEIKDLMLDLDTGRIMYAVLSVNDGFLGMNSKYFAVPIQSFKFDKEHEEAVLDINEEMFKDAPGFDKDNWPMTNDREFVERVHSHYGRDPFYEEGGRL